MDPGSSAEEVKSVPAESAKAAAPASPASPPPETEYPYRPPRVSADLYQIDVPDLVFEPPSLTLASGEVATAPRAAAPREDRSRRRRPNAVLDFPQTNASLSVDASLLKPEDVPGGGPVWAGNRHHADAETAAFARAAQGLLGVGAGGEALEEDEGILCALGAFGAHAEPSESAQDAEQAALGRLGGGAETYAVRRLRRQVASVPWLDWRRVARLLRDPPQHAYLSAKVGERYAHLPAAGPGSSSEDSSDSESEGGSPAGPAEDAEPRAFERRGTGRQELKKRWEAVGREAELLCAAAGTGPERPAASRALALMEEALGLAPPDCFPGESFSEDLSRCFKALARALLEQRLWSAQWRDAVSFAPPRDGAPSPRSSIQDLRRHAQRADALPLSPPELPSLRRLLRRAEAWEARAAALQSDRMALESLEELVASADGIPLRLEGAAPLRRRLAGAREALEGAAPLLAAQRGRRRRKVSAAALEGATAAFDAIGVDCEAARSLGAALGAYRSWAEDVRGALEEGASPGVRQLQAWVQAGRALPVDVGDLLGQLEAKVALAHQWVERVRKAVPKRKQASRSGGEGEAMDLSAVKHLLAEAEGLNVELREHSEMSEVVETAEDWIQRVHEMIKSGGDDAIDTLQTLLDEGADIPVKIDEVDVLRVEIALRHWRRRARALVGVGGGGGG